MLNKIIRTVTFLFYSACLLYIVNLTECIRGTGFRLGRHVAREGALRVGLNHFGAPVMVASYFSLRRLRYKS